MDYGTASLSLFLLLSLLLSPPPHQKQGNKHIPPVITLTLSALLHSHSFALLFPFLSLKFEIRVESKVSVFIRFFHQRFIIFEESESQSKYEIISQRGRNGIYLKKKHFFLNVFYLIFSVVGETFQKTQRGETLTYTVGGYVLP